ncbi:MAG TPA: hypothetical protein VGC79_25130 [Polyangiaceae bacterium]
MIPCSPRSAGILQLGLALLVYACAGTTLSKPTFAYDAYAHQHVYEGSRFKPQDVFSAAVTNKDATIGLRATFDPTTSVKEYQLRVQLTSGRAKGFLRASDSSGQPLAV